jgi:hypothetical protein
MRKPAATSRESEWNEEKETERENAAATVRTRCGSRCCTSLGEWGGGRFARCIAKPVAGAIVLVVCASRRLSTVIIIFGRRDGGGSRGADRRRRSSTNRTNMDWDACTGNADAVRSFLRCFAFRPRRSAVRFARRRILMAKTERQAYCLHQCWFTRNWCNVALANRFTGAWRNGYFACTACNTYLWLRLFFSTRIGPVLEVLVNKCTTEQVRATSLIMNKKKKK